MTSTDKTILHQRALWRSRRGLLELDLLFRPFVEACFVRLSPEMQIALDELLNCDDMELLELTQNPDRIPKYSTVIRTVIQFQKNGSLVKFSSNS